MADTGTDQAESRPGARAHIQLSADVDWSIRAELLDADAVGPGRVGRL